MHAWYSTCMLGTPHQFTNSRGPTHSRAMVLKISGMLSFVAMGVTIAALYIDRHHTYPDPHWTPAYWLMVIGLCLWGTFAGVYYPAMTAILADSVETGNRTSLYTYRWMLQMFTRAMGPLLGAVRQLRHDFEPFLAGSCPCLLGADWCLRSDPIRCYGPFA